MSVFWIFIGLLCIGMPHLAAGTGVAWPGAPFAGECVLVLAVLSLVRMREAYKAADLMPTASLFTALVTLIFEVVCMIVLQNKAAGNTLIVVEQLFHSLSIASWLAFAVLKSSNTESKETNSKLTGPVIAVSVAGVLAGAVWYALSHAALSQPQALLSVQSVEPILWLSTLVWALPIAVLIWCLDVNPAQHVAIAASPFAGVLLANRIWQALITLGHTPTFSLHVGITLALPAVLSVGMLLVAWLASDTGPVGDASTAKPEEPSLPSTRLPIDQLTGFEQLTDRERETVLASAAGATTDEIARALGIAPGTVSTYRSRAYAKLSVSSAQELLAMSCQLLERPRLFLEPDEKPSDTVSDQTQSHENAVGRLLPLAVCAVCAVLTMLFACLIRIIPGLGVPAFVLCGAYVLLLVCGTARAKAVASTFEQLMGLLLGAAVALALGAVIVGPAPLFARRIFIAGIVVATVVWLVWYSRGMWPKLIANVISAAGLLGLALAPPTQLVAELADNLVLYVIAVLFVVVAALVRQFATTHETSLVAPVVLEGDERALAYLMGRGLPDLQAKVALLTARGFTQGSIAKSLCISSSTVSEYRTRAYKALGIHSKDQLAELLTAEAGL